MTTEARMPEQTPEPLLIHVGYHKTATTWMQRRLFRPEHGFALVASHDEAWRWIVKPHGFDFDPAPLADHLARATAALPAGTVPVFSSEILSGQPFFGGQQSDVFAERLARVAPGARILVSIRAQAKILASLYMQYILRGGTLSIEGFFAGNDVPEYLGFMPGHFEYDRLVGHYRQLFGAENVHVMTQEGLNRDLDGTVAALAAFAENRLYQGLTPAAREKSGVSYPEYAVPVLRRVNLVQRRPLGTRPRFLYKAAGYLLKRPPFPALLGARKPVSDFVAARYAGHYAASNARLRALMGDKLDLAGYD